MRCVICGEEHGVSLIPVCLLYSTTQPICNDCFKDILWPTHQIHRAVINSYHTPDMEISMRLNRIETVFHLTLNRRLIGALS